ncbi:Proton-dependent oligopeptide transporter family [Corchorus olitorius]|uniref:Proton-dependent oligopeptide transporter family n=1 Tax=Corchorus olitorius TaxID=93759 RepID=A0A1R3J9C3_9ROSI|nr:Proton-dependent oligopeptide transporter family [Corchorus olitorius]
MAEAKESNHFPGDTESQISDSRSKKGGFITLFFIIGTVSGVMLSGFGWLANIIVYLVEEFNIESIDASQISNVVHGYMNLLPILGAFIADSYLGNFAVAAISSFISSMGIILLTLTAKISSLKPPPCENGSSLCQGPSKLQLGILYLSIAMASAGLGGSRYTLATMGANQLDKPKEKDSFFNWFFFTIFSSCVIASTALVYVQDSISWGLGFGICAAANFVALAICLGGYKYYRYDKPQGSPFTTMLRVVVAAVRKRGVRVSSRSEDYYHDEHDGTGHKVMPATPKRSFRFLNRAALKTEGDINSDGSIARPWKLCNVQQVEDLKTLIRLFPIWSTGIFLTTPLTAQSSLTVVQALAMDRHLGPNFTLPAASIIVVVLISASFFVALFDRFLFPAWQRLSGRPLTPLQRIGLGHVINVLSMVISALVEAKRLKIARAHHLDQAQHSAIVPMTVWWLFPQLVVVGIGDALHFPGHVGLYYQEFPVSLRSTATAMVSIVVGIAFYVSTALVDLIRNSTGWLPENINNGRLDNLYWILVVTGSFNFIYFLVCAKLYKYQNMEKEVDTVSNSDM